MNSRQRRSFDAPSQLQTSALTLVDRLLNQGKAKRETKEMATETRGRRVGREKRLSRNFLSISAPCLCVSVAYLALAGLAAAQSQKFDVAAFDRDRVLKAANQYLSEKPITITASSSPRSAGGVHDFFSEGDYWWPDPQNPNGPYIQRDGMSNPNNFLDHRRYLMRLSVQVPTLVAAWKLTKDTRYANHAVKHLRAWFVD